MSKALTKGLKKLTSRHRKSDISSEDAAAAAAAIAAAAAAQKPPTPPEAPKFARHLPPTHIQKVGTTLDLEVVAEESKSPVRDQLVVVDVEAAI